MSYAHKVDHSNLPKLMKLEAWRNARFVEPISKATALRYARDGVIPAKKMGGEWYVMVEEEVFSTGSGQVDEILRGIL